MLLYLDQAQSIGPDSRGARRLAAALRPRPAAARPQRESGARDPRAAHARRRRRLCPGRRHRIRPRADRLDGRAASPAGRPRASSASTGAPGASSSPARSTSPARAPSSAAPTPRRARRRRAPCSTTSPPIRAPPATSRPSSPAISPATIRRRRWSSGWSRPGCASGGDLPTVYRAIVDSPEAWARRRAKFRTPWDWSIAALRAVGTRQVEAQPAAGLLDQLGQPVWRPGSPAGFDDIAASWAGPDALMRRVEAAERLAARAGGLIDARSARPAHPARRAERRRPRRRSPAPKAPARASRCCWSRPNS